MKNTIKRYVRLFLENEKKFNSYLDDVSQEEERKAKQEEERKAKQEEERKAKQEPTLKDPNDWLFWSKINK